MKEKMDENSKSALIEYRIQRAYETLKEAKVMCRENFFNAAINRLYYACYYAAIALLLKYDLQTQTHNGVKTMDCILSQKELFHCELGKHFLLCLKNGIVGIMMILFIVMRRW